MIAMGDQISLVDKNNDGIDHRKNGDVDVDTEKMKDNALRKLLDHEKKRFQAMDIDEDGKVYEDEFIVYWRDYCKENYGYYDESADRFYKEAFKKIAGKKDYFTWKMYKEFLTKVEIEKKGGDDKIMAFF